MLDAMIVKVLVTSLALTFSTVCGQTCPPQNSLSASNYAMVKAHKTGDDSQYYLYLGGMFGSHNKGTSPAACGTVRTRGVHNLEAFLWAVRTYQSRNPDSLRGLKIGALGFDSCSDSFHLQQQLANFKQRLVGFGDPVVDPDTLLGFVGPDRSSDAMTLASYFGKHGPPMVSHAATSGSLSDKKDYPYFMRTVPSDTVQVEVLVKLLLTQNWYYIQVLNSDNAYGSAGKANFIAAAQQAGICIVNEQVIPDAFDDKEAMNAVIDGLKAHQDTRAVVIFANEDYAHAILDASGRSNARGMFTWFGTTAWATNPEVVHQVEDIAEGAVTLSVEAYQSQDDNLVQFMGYFSNLTPQMNQDNPWFKEYWSNTFQCYFLGVPNPKGYNRLCDDMQVSLSGTELDVYVPYTIKAVDAILNGLDKARKVKCQLSSDGLCDDLMNEDKWKTIWENVIDDYRVFNATTGDPVNAYYKVYNYRPAGTGCTDHCYTQVGDYSASADVLVMEPSKIHSYNMVGMRVYDATSTCNQDSAPCTICGETAPPVTTEILVPTEAAPVQGEGRTIGLRTERWVIPLIVLAGVGVLMVIFFDAYLLSKIFGTPYMKHWRTMWLGQLLLVAILLCYLTLFAFIVTPTKATCGIIRFGVGVSYSMCFAVMLVKLMILLSSDSFGGFQVLMFLFAWGIQIVVDVEWLLLRYPDVIPSPEDPTIMICQHGDFISHIESLIYVMFLIVLCTGMAIRTSRISTNHREGVFIGLSTGFAIPIWLVWILVGTLYKKPEYYDPCLAFGLLATATVILFIMFLPKVRQLNSMGVEGIYAEDDSPEYTPSVEGMTHARPPSVIGYTKGGTHSIIGYPSSQTGPPSVIGYAQNKTDDGYVVRLPNGEVYGEPVKLVNALHLRHPGTLQRVHNADTTSIRSAPMAHEYVSRRPLQAQNNGDTIHATTRVLRVTNELTGRKTPVLDRRANSELNYNSNVEYGTNRPTSRNSDNKSDIGKQTHTIAELGSL